MQFGARLSLNWLADVSGLRQAAVRLDEAGFDYVTIGGHLLTSMPGRYAERPPEVYSLPYRDPLVLFSHLAAVTHRVCFRTAVLILPMFPTALVAKQAADVSLLSGGRLQLGIGIGWQEAEYRALGQPIGERGRRVAEQITVLRLLWSEPVVSFKGRYHDIDDMGIGQLPPGPIPIWIGSGPEPQLLRRAAELADGWMPSAALGSPEPARQLQAFAREAGRPRGVAVTGRVTTGADVGRVQSDVARQVEVGATEITLSPPDGSSMAHGVAGMIAALARVDGPTR
jgi:probable F420-dependent oxidoreductase